MRARVPVPAPDAAWRRESCGACAMFREYPHEVRRLAHDNWVPKHRIVWEEANGRPVPDGCIVVFLDGDRSNFDPGNLAIETRAEHAVIARNGIAYRDAATHEAARAIARLKSAAHRKAKQPRTGRRAGGVGDGGGSA